MSTGLDDLKRISRIDGGNMLEAVDKFPDFLTDTTRLENVRVSTPHSPDNVVLVGMGGSASAADVLHDWLGPRLKIPISVLRDSRLPRFVNRQTLLIAVSYSGETGETLTVFHQAARRGCALAGISSGGRLAMDCKKLKAPFLVAPKGLLPRAALAPMVGAMAIMFESYGLVANARTELLLSSKELARLRRTLNAETPTDRNIAKKLANRLRGKLPVIYALQRMSSVARRAKNQFAENSKLLAKYDLLPEAGHNEIVAWESRDPRACPLIIRDVTEDEKERALVEAFKKTLIRVCRTNPLEVRARAVSSLGRLLAPILTFDYVSVYLAFQKGTDPTPTLGIQEYRRLFSEGN